MAWQPDDDPRFAPATRELLDWVNSGLDLRRPTATKLHHLIDDWKAGKLARPQKADDSEQDFDVHTARLLTPDYQVFLVEHDWARAFEGATDFAVDLGTPYDFRVPYPYCCFEFLLSGKAVCLLVHFDGENYGLATFVQLTETWLQPPLRWQEFRPLVEILNAQFRAIGIALEAEIAITEVIRAPFKLNRAKERRGRAPVNDYHVVKLARPSRPERLQSVSGADRRGVRLHFRRGHWRHFEHHKSWIKWTLVGDPDLGFIEKHYSL
jgi:hypothetical protein